MQTSSIIVRGKYCSSSCYRIHTYLYLYANIFFCTERKCISLTISYIFFLPLWTFRVPYDVISKLFYNIFHIHIFIVTQMPRPYAHTLYCLNHTVLIFICCFTYYPDQDHVSILYSLLHIYRTAYIDHSVWHIVFYMNWTVWIYTGKT